MAKKHTDPAQGTQPRTLFGFSQKVGSVLTVLIVLLVLVGVADLLLWGVVGYYAARGDQRESDAGTVQSVPVSDPVPSPPSGETAVPAEVPASDEEKQEALLAYLRGMAELERLETEALKSYGSVSGTNYTDDAAMYAEISEHTLPLSQRLDAQAAAIAPSDSEIAELHGLYRDYASKYLSALTVLASALGSQDAAQAAEANSLINEANDLALRYQQALQGLAGLRGVALGG